ncbi:MAG: hypothetical protein JO076_04780, partial [Verrucomicrobia bacterium]|nr:hypothetical protein [Verrucomicrobiota bacterium]
MKVHRILTILTAFSATMSLSFAADIDLWFTPMSSQGPTKEPLIKWTRENFPILLPGITVGDNFGPPVYQDGQQKFIVQGRKGKPDVIESVLEGMIAYQRAGLLAPIEEQFAQWPDKDQFVPSTIK